MTTETVTVSFMSEANGKLARLSRDEVAQLTRAPRARSPEERRAAVRRATRGLRVDVRVTPRLYGRG